MRARLSSSPLPTGADDHFSEGRRASGDFDSFSTSPRRPHKYASKTKTAMTATAKIKRPMKRLSSTTEQ